MLATETCPICGTGRTGSFRFCRSCGLDFDADVPKAEPNEESAPTAMLGSEPVTDTSPETAAGSATTATEAPSPTAPEAPSPTAPEAPSPTAPAATPSANDVIVIKKRHLRLGAGVVIGGLIGSMIAGALVVPLFDESLAAVGAAAGVLTIVAGALIGMRVAARKA
jgi:hypothetical protein